MHMIRLAAAPAVLCLLMLAGCEKKEPPPPPKKPPVAKLVIGMIPEQNIFHQFERYEPLMGYVGRKTGIRFELEVLPRYGNIVSTFRTKGLDGAFFGSFTYVLAHARMGLSAVARPENERGVSTYHGMIFVRKDSGIRGVKDMKGKRLACVDKATTAGYLLPMAYFQENGIDHPRRYLKEVYFTGTHEGAILDVLNRKADVGAAKNTVFDRIWKEEPRIGKELLVLTTSPEVPENALALRGDLDEGIQKSIRNVLLGMHQDPEGVGILRRFGAKRFVETTDGDYDVVKRYAKEAGIDLATYDYMND